MLRSGRHLTGFESEGAIGFDAFSDRNLMCLANSIQGAAGQRGCTSEDLRLTLDVDDSYAGATAESIVHQLVRASCARVSKPERMESLRSTSPRSRAARSILRNPSEL